MKRAVATDPRESLLGLLVRVREAANRTDVVAKAIEKERAVWRKLEADIMDELIRIRERA